MRWLVTADKAMQGIEALTHAALVGWATESLVQTAFFECGRAVRKIWFFVIAG